MCAKRFSVLHGEGSSLEAGLHDGRQPAGFVLRGLWVEPEALSGAVSKGPHGHVRKACCPSLEAGPLNLEE